MKKYLSRFFAFILILAVTSSSMPLFSAPFVNEESPAIIIADMLDYDPENEVATAEGHVEIQQGDRIMLADKVVYERNTNTVKAYGNISLLEPDGNVYFSDQVILRDDLKIGVVNNFRARMIDNSMLAGSVAVRENEYITRLDRAVYSPCKLCEEDPSRAPLWQIKADKVKVDQQEEKVHYRNGKFEIYGVPMLYTPYFSHPTPNAKHKSGLLVPTYSHITTLGTTAKIPYYYNISPNADATIVPFLTTEEGPVLSGEFRHLVNNGYYQFKGSITNPDKRDVDGSRIPGQETRGHIEGYGNFAINDYWNWGFDGKRSSDDTYLRRYKFGDEDKLTSVGYIEKIKQRDYLSFRGVTFQELNQNDNPDETPYALPLVVSHLESQPGYNGSKFEFDTNALALTRDKGSNTRRLSAAAGWKLPYISKSTGSVLEFSTRMRGDAYYIDSDPDPLAPTPLNDDDYVGRALPEAKLNWSLPFARLDSFGRTFIEPVAEFIVSPYGGNPPEIPNEDSQELELSDVNIFSSSHFSGLDRVESGPRTNYGLRGGFFSNGGGNVNFLFGQSYRTKVEDELQRFSGFDDNFSDYVGRIAFYDGKALDLAYRFRLDNEELTPNRNEISTSLNINPFRFNIDYVTLDRGTDITDTNREEIFASSSMALSQNWMLHGNIRRDLSKNGGLISSGGGVFYQNECIIVSTEVNREFIRDRDIEPSTSYSLQISFKNIN